MTPEERKLGLERVGRWPRKDVVAASDLTPKEQELIVLAAALLNIRPA